MPAFDPSSHARHLLLFWLDESSSRGCVDIFSDFLEIVSASREWTISPPRLVEIDNGACEEVGFGGVPELYSTTPPNKVPQDVDRQELADVEALVRTLADFSGRQNVSIEWRRQTTSPSSSAKSP